MRSTSLKKLPHYALLRIPHSAFRIPHSAFLAFFSFWFLVLPQIGRSQICEVRTTPGSTVNEWDWRAHDVYEVYIGDRGGFYRDYIQSPFRSDRLNFHPNVVHLAFELPLDYEPSDGWELLFRNFGTSSKPVQEPAFGLYNRYESMIRVFYYMTPDEVGKAQNATLSIKHNINVNQYVTSLFEHINTPMGSLDNFEKNVISIGQPNEMLINGTWLLLEVPTAYDPCVCTEKTTLEIGAIHTNIMELELDIDGQGNTTPISLVSGGDVQHPIGSAIRDVDGAIGSIASGFKIYKDLSGYLEDDYDSRFVSVLADLLPDWVPAVGTAAKILSFFIGGGKSSASTRIIGYNHNFSFHATGTSSEITNFDRILLLTPGSDNQSLPSANIPVYDNPLGVFNLLRTPVVETAYDYQSYANQLGEYEEWEWTKFKLNGDVAYAVNTTAGIDPNPNELLGALYFEDCFGDPENVGLLPTDEEGVWHTPVIPLPCLADYTVEFERYEARWIENLPEPIEELDGDFCDDRDPTLQVIATLTGDPAADEIVFAGRYRTREANNLDFATFPTNPFAGLNDAQIVESCTYTVPAPATDVEIAAFCADDYDAQLAKALVEKILRENLPAEKIGEGDVPRENIRVYPNPFIDRVTLSLPAEFHDQDISLTLFNGIGVPVTTQEITAGKEVILDSVFDRLPTGSYYVEIRNEDRVERVALVKQ